MLMLSEKPWTLERVALFFLAMAVCCGWVSLAGGAVAHYRWHDHPDDNSLLYLFFATMSIHGAIVLAAAAVLWWSRVSWREAFGFDDYSARRAIMLGALAGLVFLPVGWALQALSAEAMDLLHRTVKVQEAVQMMEKTDTWDSRLYFIFWSIFFAPLAEEILFRGILYPAIKRLGYPRGALWISALAFAAIHVNLPIFAPLLGLGLALALLYDTTNNLLAPIVAHGFFNAANVLIFYIGQHGHSSPPG
jgi:membrane protease YdiL (CAAX protease family)